METASSNEISYDNSLIIFLLISKQKRNVNIAPSIN